MLVAEEVDGIGPSEATCVGADRPGSDIAKALATPISTPLAILVDISSWVEPPALPPRRLIWTALVADRVATLPHLTGGILASRG